MHIVYLWPMAFDAEGREILQRGKGVKDDCWYA
jgi:hypothetical protein